MEEYIELLDHQGNFTGEKCLKSVAHKKGLLHATIHLWLYKANKVLIQKRVKTKATFPDLWDVSVAGHVHFGERPSQTVLRETQEELGLSLAFSEITFIGMHREKVVHKKDFIDNEWHYIYTAPLKKELSELHLQKDEVAEVQLMDWREAKENFLNPNKNYVPYTAAYFEIDKVLFPIINKQ